MHFVFSVTLLLLKTMLMRFYSLVRQALFKNKICSSFPSSLSLMHVHPHTKKSVSFKSVFKHEFGTIFRFEYFCSTWLILGRFFWILAIIMVSCYFGLTARRKSMLIVTKNNISATPYWLPYKCSGVRTGIHALVFYILLRRKTNTKDRRLWLLSFSLSFDMCLRITYGAKCYMRE